MPRRKCTQKQLEALRRGREKRAHKRSKKTTNGFLTKMASTIGTPIVRFNQWLINCKSL